MKGASVQRLATLGISLALYLEDKSRGRNLDNLEILDDSPVAEEVLKYCDAIEKAIKAVREGK